MVDWFARYLSESWPVLAALALVGAITWGAMRPYMKKNTRDDKDT